MSKQYKTKKAISFGDFMKVALSLLIVVVFFCVGIVDLMTSWEADTTENGIEVYYNKITKSCFVGSYFWGGNTENTIIVVPDEYENYKISSLGGVYGRGVPVNFSVVMPDEVMEDVYSVSDERENNEAMTYTFTVILGKNVNNLTNLDYENYYYNEDGSVSFIVKMNYECLSDNEWIYSKDGKLYDKKTGKMIELQ